LAVTRRAVSDGGFCGRLDALRVVVGGLRLEHPVMNASGVLGSSPAGIAKLASLGFSAVVTKTLTPEPREGFSPPIIVQLPTGGILNAVGLANPGRGAIPALVSAGREAGLPVIVSIGGRDAGEFAGLAEVAEDAGAAAVELNLSCPNARGYGMELGSDPRVVREVVRAVDSTVGIPVMAKLGLSDRVVESAGAALEGGADALVLINTVRATYIDVYTLRPVLTATHGGLSGPPIHPIAVRVVYDVFREYGCDIVGVGGVHDWASAAEFIAAGAKAVQIGTAVAYDEGVVRKVVEGLARWVEVMGASSVSDLVGAAVRA